MLPLLLAHFLCQMHLLPVLPVLPQPVLTALLLHQKLTGGLSLAELSAQRVPPHQPKAWASAARRSLPPGCGRGGGGP